MPATRQAPTKRPIDGAGEPEKSEEKQTTTRPASQIKARECKQSFNKRADEKGIKNPSQKGGAGGKCGDVGRAGVDSSAPARAVKSHSGLPEQKAASSSSSVAGSGSGSALRTAKAGGTPSPAGNAGADSDLVNVANENRVILNVGGIRHETYKVSLIGAKFFRVRLAPLAPLVSGERYLSAWC